MDADLAHREKFEGNSTRMLRTIFGSNIPQNNCTVTLIPSLKPFKSDKQDMRGTIGEVRMNPEATFSRAPIHTDEQVLDDQLYIHTIYLEDLLSAMDDKEK